MSQVDKISVDNGSGRAVRMGFNHLIEAVADHFSGPKAPGFTFAGMFWRDTSKSPAILRMRNDANTAWITFRDIIGLGLHNSPTFVGVNATGNVTATGDVTARNVTATANVTAHNVEVNSHIEMHAAENHDAYIDMRSNGRSGDYDWRMRNASDRNLVFDAAGNAAIVFHPDGTIYSKKYGSNLGFTGNLSGSGYQKLPSGLIIQWGDLSLKSWDDGRYSCYFPIVFPNKAFSITFGTTNSYSHESVRATVLISKTKAKMELHNHIAWNNGEKFRSYFIAIGN